MSKKLITVATGAVVAIGIGAGVASASTTNSSSTELTLTTQVVTATVGPFPTQTVATATCPTGTAVTGGGYNAGTASGTAVGESYPDDNGWTAVMTGGPSGATLTVYAVCASLG